MDKVLVIQIAGRACSGRTTLAVLLHEFLASKGFDVDINDEDVHGSVDPVFQAQRVDAIIDRKIFIETRQTR